MSGRSQWVDATLARSLLAGVSRALKSFAEEFGRGDLLFHFVVGR